MSEMQQFSPVLFFLLFSPNYLAVSSKLNELLTTAYHNLHFKLTTPPTITVQLIIIQGLAVWCDTNKNIIINMHSLLMHKDDLIGSYTVHTLNIMYQLYMH